MSQRTDIQGKFDYYFPRTTYVDKGATDSIGKIQSYVVQIDRPRWETRNPRDRHGI